MTSADIPGAGPTGLSHEHSAAVDLAAAWLAMEPNDRISQPIIPLLRQRFGLSAQEACEACKEANLIRATSP